MKNQIIVFLLLLVVFAEPVFSQKKVTLEKVRCFSTTGPVMNYWRSEEVKKAFLTDLASSLMRHQGIVLPDTSQVRVEFLTNASAIGSAAPEFTDTAAGLLHLYFDVYELDMNFFSLARKVYTDTNLQKRAVSVFVLKATMLNGQKKNVFEEELYVSVTRGESTGIGLPYNSFNAYGKLPASVKGFSGLLGKGIDILLDPDNEIQLVEMKVAPAYIADNFILGRAVDQPRTLVTTQKGVSRYTYAGKVEIIRLGDPLFEDIIFSGKKAQVYPASVMAAIRRSSNFETSSFVFLRQDGRDVARDKNYLIKIMVQIDPDFRVSGPKGMLTNFIQEPIHYLLSEKDTVATFFIRKNVLNEEGKKLYLNQVSNGVDLNSILRLDIGSEWTVKYNYVITGTIGRKSFRITFTGSDNSLKEFYLDGKMVCIAEGATSLNKFVVFDTTVAPELLNQLFLIGFNAFTE